MKLKALLITGAAMAVAVPTVAGAAQGGTTRDSITGGGQAFFDERDPTGAGDTIAFQAQRERGADTSSTDADGNIQVRRRGTNSVKFHGEFECLVVNGDPGSGAGYAFGSGESRSGEPFELYVSDGGKGQLERDDMIMLYYGDDEVDDNGSDGPCGFEEFEAGEDSIELARGNVQVRNRSLDEDADPQSKNASEASALSLSFLGL